VKKSGAWFTYEGEQLGQGRENARQFLVEHPEVAEEIERRVREAVGVASFGPADDVPVVVDEGPPAEGRASQPASAS